MGGIGSGRSLARKWNHDKVIRALIEFYRENKRFPRSKENLSLYNGCRLYFGGNVAAIREARRIMAGVKRVPEKKFDVPCGVELGWFITKCYHTRACANGRRCKIAVPDAGHSQFCGAPVADAETPRDPFGFKRGAVNAQG